MTDSYDIKVRIPQSAVGTLTPIKPISSMLDEYTGSDRRTLAYNIAREVHWAQQKCPADDPTIWLRIPIKAHSASMATQFTVELLEALKLMPSHYPLGIRGMGGASHES